MNNQNLIQEVSYTNPEQPIAQTKEGPNSNMYYKGGLIGAAVTAFASWNTGRYNRIGHFLRRWKFIRYFVSIKPFGQSNLITNYHRPNLNVIADNFYCYSGQSGIGKSFHFQDLTQKQSYCRPTLYVSFKSTGRQVNFQNDLSEQLKFGEDGAGIIAEIIRAMRKIKEINTNPFRFVLKYCFTHALFIGIYSLLLHSNFAFITNSLLLSSTLIAQLYYIKFMGPLLEQSSRGTLPVIIFDDVNKIEQMNMLAEIVRFLKIIEDQTANIILVSSDEETWSNLRRQPGMKDRLRIRNIRYDHIQTANRMIKQLSENVELFKANMTPNPILDVTMLKVLINELIGQRQMSIRRFLSLIKLVDQQQYELYIQILKNPNLLPISDVVKNFRQIFFDFQAETMVTNLKTIKRQLSSITLNDFLFNLDLLLKKNTLTSDNKIAPNLKLYNIVRDLRSEYVITGRYTYIILEMALNKYKNDIKEYELKGQAPPS